MRFKCLDDARLAKDMESSVYFSYGVLGDMEEHH
jgi:hypothetical protein